MMIKIKNEIKWPEKLKVFNIICKIAELHKGKLIFAKLICSYQILCSNWDQIVLFSLLNFLYNDRILYMF